MTDLGLSAFLFTKKIGNSLRSAFVDYTAHSMEIVTLVSCSSCFQFFETAGWGHQEGPYHLGHHGLDLPRTMLRPVKMAQCTSPAGMGVKDRECIRV